MCLRRLKISTNSVKKPLTARQVKDMEWYRGTLPTHKESEILLLMRIRDPKIFPYSKPYELHKKSALVIEERLEYIMMMMRRLPKKLQESILAETSFLGFVTDDILGTIENELKKKQRIKKKRNADKDEIYENMDALYEMYKKFFNIGIKGFKELMPDEFQNYFDKQINPILELMNGIGAYTNKIKGHKPLLKPYSFSQGI